MKNDNILKTILMMGLSVFILWYSIYNFIYGDRRFILSIMSIVGISVTIFTSLKNINNIKNSENPQLIFQSKLALLKIVVGAVILAILVPVGFIFFT